MDQFRVGSKITRHSVRKMSGLDGTFANNLCQVIFVRSFIYDDSGSIQGKLAQNGRYTKSSHKALRLDSVCHGIEIIAE